MYAFTSRSKMETDIKNGRYLEHGEYDGNLYGLKIDSIHEVVEAGRVCILDANPEVEANTSYCRKKVVGVDTKSKLIMLVRLQQRNHLTFLRKLFKTFSFGIVQLRRLCFLSRSNC